MFLFILESCIVSRIITKMIGKIEKIMHDSVITDSYA